MSARLNGAPTLSRRSDSDIKPPNTIIKQPAHIHGISGLYHNLRVQPWSLPPSPNETYMSAKNVVYMSKQLALKEKEK